MTNPHTPTGLHQALHELRHGSVTEAKQIRFEADSNTGECEACCCRGIGAARSFESSMS
ncbi:hypothetical protein [aff. Roholtiella sp. LEGE 12411]|uniref:hypothetical protein n=1 Tax=aff. Roholtiella sp. LEGE 12411 TaxID=1828822 RepID=UPI00187F03AB|nr:hypothetical protein [aff. Roholtiella sp. LEGE 12411]MBE9036793.1 hypothetical protein [aff. Roholtiella sp. LEGE 12411]